MRHAFSFPRHIRNAVKEHIRRAFASVDINRFAQEPAYTAALASHLHGMAYEGPDGRVEFSSTIVSDRGPRSAEKLSGADLIITADISDNNNSIKKAIMVQCKKGIVEKMNRSEIDSLIKQINTMKHHTRSPKVMEIPILQSSVMPNILSGNEIRKGHSAMPYPLDDYFVQRVLTTLDGDTRPEFVDSVQESNLTRLFVLAKLNK